MKLKNLEKKENNVASFQVETDAAEFEKAVNGAYLKAKSNINIPGFRKGKVPRTVVEGMYGAEVFYQDAMDELAPAAFETGVKEAELRVVGRPAIKDVNVTDERTAEYTFEVTLYPEVTLGQYKGLEATKKEIEVSDADVEKEIMAVAKRNARMNDIDDRAAVMGDTANIDFEGFLEGVPFEGGKGEGYALELGSNSFVPGFEEQVAGMTIGEEKDIDITFPENYTADLAGKAVVFKVKLNGISAPELPELDDEFAKDVSEFDTLDEYKAGVRANLEKKAAEDVDTDFRAQIIKQAVNNMTVEVPDCMITEKMEETLRSYASNFGFNDPNMTLESLVETLGISEEAMNSNVRPAAEFQVKTDMLLEAIMETENIEADDEAFNAYVEKVAKDVQASTETLRQYFGEDFMKGEFKKELATNIMIESAVVKAAE